MFTHDFNGIVVKANIGGIHVVKEDDDFFWVKAGAGVVWHDLVESCIKANFGGIENLKGKKIAMSWAYSPSYGKPLSVPQGIVGLMTRFGMDVVLSHPEGYGVMPDVEAIALQNAKEGGGSFSRVDSMAEAFEDADIVYPKSWAPFEAMEQRTELYGQNDFDGISELEKELLAQNARFKDWECTEKLMSTTRDGNALYMHCLPAHRGEEISDDVLEGPQSVVWDQAENKMHMHKAILKLLITRKND